MKKALLVFLSMISLTGSAAATPQDDTTSGSGTGTISRVGSGHSQYAYFFFGGTATCGTAATYFANGVRVSTGHPRYQDMLRTLLAAHLTGASVSSWTENISGQCWLKQISFSAS